MTTTPIEPQAEITLHNLKAKFASFITMANKVAGDGIAYTMAEWIEQIAEHEPSRTTPAPSLEYARGFEAGLHDLKAMTAEEDAYHAASQHSELAKEIADALRTFYGAGRASTRLNRHLTDSRFSEEAERIVALRQPPSDAMREALTNASGFLDTPVARRKHSNDPFYTEVVASIRTALTQGKPDASNTVSPADVEGLVKAAQDANQAVQAFLDMVNVMQRIGAIPIPAILETAQHNCPIIRDNLNAALAPFTKEPT